mmetsp:Transcript_45467/g.90006  ORF Transcript_45467/g.90006 Transcript_45467/m.90006 type:complete len:116 (+) Transcript_45467:51-398(+)
MARHQIAILGSFEALYFERECPTAAFNDVEFRADARHRCLCSVAGRFSGKSGATFPPSPALAGRLRTDASLVSTNGAGAGDFGSGDAASVVRLAVAGSGLVAQRRAESHTSSAEC